MIEIKCPACGAGGRATKEKILTRLVCRKCLKVFHVTPSGKSVLGEPPATGQTATADPQKTVDRTQTVEEWFDRASTRFSSPTTLILAVGLILLVVAAVHFAARSPERLQDRVAQAARAAVQGDLRTIREMAATGTSAEVSAWYLSIRPQCDELLVRLGSKKLAVDTVVKQVDSTQEQIELVAQVSIEEGLERSGNLLPDASSVVTPITPPLSLPMAWKSEGRSGWRLDGKRTQELSKGVR
jgi:hypothetical protein